MDRGVNTARPRKEVTRPPTRHPFPARQDLGIEDTRGRIFAHCRARGTRVRVEVLDLTTSGGLLDLRTWGLKTGERILVRLPGLAYLPATVIWVEDGRGGVAFETPLHEAVLRHILMGANRA